MRALRLVGLMAIFSLSASVAMAVGAPSAIVVQGRLTDSTGTPLAAGIKTLTFQIFDAETGGTDLWPPGESHAIDIGADGLWTATVGKTSPIPLTVFGSETTYLQITVDDHINPPEVLPRVGLKSVPYAHHVGTVDSSFGGNILGKLSVGDSHSNTGVAAFVAGTGHWAWGNYSTITGGFGGRAYGELASIGGGIYNIAADSFTTVGGGNRNQADGHTATVGGGQYNIASGASSSILGGAWARARGDRSVVGGGGGSLDADSNAAIGDDSAILGGGRNIATGEYSAIGGGDSNYAAGDYSAIPGGQGNSAYGKYSFAAGRRAKAFHDGSIVLADSTDEDFGTTGANQVLIRASGGIGINTNLPDVPFHMVVGSAGSVIAHTSSMAAFESNADGYISLLTPETSERGFLFADPTSNVAAGIIYNNPGTRKGLQFRTFNNEDRMAIDSIGNVGIGVMAPTNLLTVKQYSNTDPIADAWTTYSSRRWKENIRTLDSPIETVRQLRGVSYDWKKTGKHDIGVVAEEVAEVVPEVVTYDADGADARAVDYGRLVAVLIEAVKEQQTQIEAQNVRIDRQQKQIDALLGKTR